MLAAATDSKTKLLNAALHVFRQKGYTATTVDDLWRAAGVTKGSFFHHFASKEDITLAAVAHWNAVTGALFESAPYHQMTDPRERLLAYIDYRAALIHGSAPEFSCLLGTLVQEAYDTHPALRDACLAGIESHAFTPLSTIEQARARCAPQAGWSSESLAPTSSLCCKAASSSPRRVAVHSLRSSLSAICAAMSSACYQPPLEPKEICPCQLNRTFFNGRCEEALDFYGHAIGARVDMLMRFSESPDPVPEGQLAPGFENKIMHASFLVGGARIMASDGCSGEPVFQGFSLSLAVPNEAEARRVFGALAESGRLDMPIGKTFWSPCFGMITDRFGVQWMVTLAESGS